MAESAVKFYSILKDEKEKITFVSPVKTKSHPDFFRLLKTIEENKIDITEGYLNWFAIGCGIANTFSESGRDYFHSISKFYTKYTQKETDTQYTACLKRSGKEKGYTLKKVFAIAALYEIVD